MKKLRNLIIIIAILIILVLSAIIILNYRQNLIYDGLSGSDIPFANENIISTQPDEDNVEDGRTSEDIDESALEAIPENTELEELTNGLYYFVVKNCMEQYIKIININSSVYYGHDESGNYTDITPENEKKERIYNVLSSAYIEKNNITIDNMFSYINTFKEDMVFVPIEMKQLENSEKIKTFAVYGLIEKVQDYSMQEDVFAIVNIDETNLTFSIEPVKNVSSIKNISAKKMEENIEKNEENTYVYQSILDEDFAREYMSLYKRLSIGSPELMYERLDVDYRNKRFGSLENFEQYINENYDKIYSTNLQKYLVQEKEGYKQYVLLDQNNNYYIFQEKSLMNYTVILDTYTVDLPEYIEKYNTANEETKVKMNISRFFEAIKLGDFEYAHNKIDETVKKTYFPTLTEFEAYAKNAFIYENIEYDEFTDSEGVYTYTVKLQKKKI